MTIEIEIRRLSTSWLAIVRRNGIWVAQAQALTEQEAVQQVSRVLREMRDGIDALLERL